VQISLLENEDCPRSDKAAAALSDDGSGTQVRNRIYAEGEWNKVSQYRYPVNEWGMEFRDGPSNKNSEAERVWCCIQNFGRQGSKSVAWCERRCAAKGTNSKRRFRGGGRGDSCVAPIQRAKVLLETKSEKMKRKIRGQ